MGRTSAVKDSIKAGAPKSPAPMSQTLRRASRGSRNGVGGVGCLEDRRFTVPVLREEIISIICEEWPNSDEELNEVASEEWPNSDEELNEVAIHERLKVAGVGASQDGVLEVLLQLSDHEYIRLAGEPGAPGGLAVVYVDPELCP
jgi:hypothetical protein